MPLSARSARPRRYGCTRYGWRGTVRGCDSADMEEDEAYREVSREGGAYPMMSISVAGEDAVVHLFRNPDSCFFLDRDQALDERESRLFPVLGVEVVSSGSFV